MLKKYFEKLIFKNIIIINQISIYYFIYYLENKYYYIY